MDDPPPDRARNACVLLMGIGVVATAALWWYALTYHRYSLKVGFLAPLGFVVGLAFTVFPGLRGKTGPEEKGRIVGQFASFIAGAAAGGLNLWLLARS